MNRTPDDIARSLEDAGKSRDLPPLDKWHPELSGDMDLVITRDGQWVFKGEPIARAATRNGVSGLRTHHCWPMAWK